MMNINDDLHNSTFHNNVYQALKNRAKKAQSHVLTCNNNKCSKNFTINTTEWIDDKNENWLLNLSCSICNAKWSICSVCNNFKTKLIEKRQIDLHRNRYHKKKIYNQKGIYHKYRVIVLTKNKNSVCKIMP